MPSPARSATPAEGSPDGASRGGSRSADLPVATLTIFRPTGLGLHANASGDYLVLSIASGTSTGVSIMGLKRCQDGIDFMGIGNRFRSAEANSDARANSANEITIGDVVEAIDGASLRGQSQERINSLLDGIDNTSVHLRLRRTHRERPPPAVHLLQAASPAQASRPMRDRDSSWQVSSSLNSSHAPPTVPATPRNNILSPRNELAGADGREQGASLRLLPPNWEERVSKSTGRTYFYNTRTGASTWDWPSARNTAGLGMPVESEGPVVLKPLPFDYGALEPRLSRQALTLHHKKHHAKHVAIINGMIRGTEMEKDSLEEIMLKAHRGGNLGLFNNAASTWNHDFFWKCLSPSGGGRPEPELLVQIEKDFTSLQHFKEIFESAAQGVFGSGWVWVSWSAEEGRTGRLMVEKTTGAGNPITEARRPILTLDVWEHAFYVDFHNMKQDYVRVFLEKLVCWPFAAQNLRDARAHGGSSGLTATIARKAAP